MPTCPGCYERVSHQRLPIHKRYCPAGLATNPNATSQVQSMEHLHRSVSLVEQRLEERIEQLERSLADVRSDVTTPSRRNRQ